MLVIHYYVVPLTFFYIVSPPSVTVSDVSNPYDIGQPVAVDCTVIAVVPDSHNRARIRWTEINNDVNMMVEVPPTTMNGIHSINYTHPLTINSTSLSDADQYRCVGRILSGNVMYLQNSDPVTQDISVYITCKLYYHNIIYNSTI